MVGKVLLPLPVRVQHRHDPFAHGVQRRVETLPRGTLKLLGPLQDLGGQFGKAVRRRNVLPVEIGESHLRVAEPDGQDVRRFHLPRGISPPRLGDDPFREGVGRIGRRLGQPNGAEDHPGQGLEFRVPLARLGEHDRQQQALVPHQPDLPPLPFACFRFAEQALESVGGTFQSNVFPRDIQRHGAGQSRSTRATATPNPIPEAALHPDEARGAGS